jgi:hypothetical protein
MPGPTSTDANFERTFADLAYARLRDKAPSLLDDLIGFQLVDKNDDETHAVGVFGFKVSSEWVYAPVFFINGELKGHELMYIKSQDAFVPLIESWVNYLLNRRPPVLGEGEPTPKNQLALNQPDFDLFARTPHLGSKYASARRSMKTIYKGLDDDYKPFMSVFLPQNWPNSEKYAGLTQRCHLPNFLKTAGQEAVYTLIKTMRDDVKFANAVLRYYDIKDLVNVNYSKPTVKRAADGDTKIEGTAPKVVVITRSDDGSAEAQGLSEAEKKKLMKDQYVVKDERSDDKKARMYKSQISRQLENPSENGFYEVLTTYGTAERVLILTAPDKVGYTPKSGTAVVVCPNGKRFGNYYATDVFISKRLSKEDWKKCFESDFVDPKQLKVDQYGMLVAPDAGNGTMVFEVTSKHTNGEGQTEMQVRGHCCINESSRVYNPARINNAPRAIAYSHEDDCCIESIVLTGKDGDRSTQIGKTMFIPNTWKAIQLPNVWKDGMGGAADLGSLSECVLQLYKTAQQGDKGVYRLQLRTDGINYMPVINGHVCNSMSKLACLKHLIVQQNFSQEDAEFLIKQARPRKAETFYVKQAQNQPISGYFPEPPQGYEYGIPAPIQYPQYELQNLNESMGHNREHYRDNREMDGAVRQYAQEAAQTGQKEVLDTAVISGLVDTMDVDDAVDKYLSDLLLGLDRVGRILFMYYWHYDQFKERYGQQDMTELEDNLRNVFKNLGELALFLKQKTIEPEMAETSEAELTDVLG